MRRVVSSTFVSLDGVINHMDRWHFDFIDDESDAIALEQLSAADALLMGRSTYDIYAQAWPGREGAYADRINQITKYIASKTLSDPTWANSLVLPGDLVDAVRDLKDQPGADILMHGYGPVAKALMRHHLVDELCLWVHPMLAGVGTVDDMIFSEGLNQRLALASARPLASGVVLLTYQANG